MHKNAVQSGGGNLVARRSEGGMIRKRKALYQPRKKKGGKEGPASMARGEKWRTYGEKQLNHHILGKKGLWPW